MIRASRPRIFVAVAVGLVLTVALVSCGGGPAEPTGSATETGSSASPEEVQRYTTALDRSFVRLRRTLARSARALKTFEAGDATFKRTKGAFQGAGLAVEDVAQRLERTRPAVGYEDGHAQLVEEVLILRETLRAYELYASWYGSCVFSAGFAQDLEREGGWEREFVEDQRQAARDYARRASEKHPEFVEGIRRWERYVTDDLEASLGEVITARLPAPLPDSEMGPVRPALRRGTCYA